MTRHGHCEAKMGKYRCTLRRTHGGRHETMLRTMRFTWSWRRKEKR